MFCNTRTPPRQPKIRYPFKIEVLTRPKNPIPRISLAFAGAYRRVPAFRSAKRYGCGADALACMTFFVGAANPLFPPQDGEGRVGLSLEQWILSIRYWIFSSMYCRAGARRSQAILPPRIQSVFSRRLVSTWLQPGVGTPSPFPRTLSVSCLRLSKAARLLDPGFTCLSSKPP